MSPSMTISAISAAVGAGLTITVRPAVGSAYCITDVMSDALFITNVADISVEIIDGTHTAGIFIIDPSTPFVAKAGRKKEILITNAVYMQLTNTGGAGSNLGWSGYRVNVNKVMTYMTTVVAAATHEIRPAVAGITWRICEIAVQRVGAASHPDMTFGIANATLTASIIMRQADLLKQNKLLDWYVDRMTWVLCTPTGAGDNDIAVMGWIVDVEAFSGVVDNLAADVTNDIRPDPEQECVITEFAAETWSGVASPNDEPDVGFALYDGTDLAALSEAGSVAGGTTLAMDREIEIHIDRDTYIRCTDASGADNEIGWLGYVKRESTD